MPFESPEYDPQLLKLMPDIKQIKYKIDGEEFKKYVSKNPWVTREVFKAAYKIMNFDHTFQDVTGSKVELSF